MKVEHGATYFWSPATYHTKLHATFLGKIAGLHQATGCMQSVACNLVASCGPPYTEAFQFLRWLNP